MTKAKTVQEKGTSNIKSLLKNNISSISSILGLVLCILVFTITTGGQLWSKFNIGVIVETTSVFLIMALGAIFIYSMGYMDVSLGAQLGVYCILMCVILEKTHSLVLALLIVLVIALLCGIFNGVVSVWLGLPSIVTSLFLSSIFTGIQYLMVEAITKTYEKPSNVVFTTYNLDKLLDPKLSIPVMIIIGLLAYYAFTYTRLGKYVKAIGANELTTKQCGVNTTLWKTFGYMALGITVAIGSLFYLSRTGAASKDTGNGYAMNVMLCLILGGMPLSGGMRSKLRCAIVGALTYVLLDNGLTVSGVDIKLVYIFKALVFLSVVIITCRSKNQTLPR